MSKLFHYIDSLFQSWPPTSTHMSLIEAAGLSLAVLAKMLDCNTTDIIKDDFSTFANSLSHPLEESLEPEEISICLQATKHLHYISQRLQIGNYISNLEVQSRSSITQETFVLVCLVKMCIREKRFRGIFSLCSSMYYAHHLTRLLPCGLLLNRALRI